MRNKTNLWLFLAGLGSATQVHLIGSIALTELAFFITGPFLLFKNYRLLKRDGFLPCIWLIVLVCFGCIISSKVNHTPMVFMLKGLAFPAVYLVAAISLHHLLRLNLDGLKWYMLGAFLSGIICIFVFQPETFTGGADVVGEDARRAVMGYALFWSNKINGALKLPINCCYLSTPIWYTGSVPIIGGVISMLISSGSGRAAAAVSFASWILLIIGGRSRKKMATIGKRLWLLLCVGIIAAIAFKTAYSYSARNGLLGEKARTKYEKQTETGTGIINILMAGRMELFCGLMACADRPIIGFGPRPIDENGYAERFLRDHGSLEDYQYYLNVLEHCRRDGYTAPPIPAHSHVVFFWLYYGIFGLVLWLYVVWLMYKYLRFYAPAIPQWFGLMCFSIPSMAWSILFNPPGFRLSGTMFVVTLLFAKAVYENKLSISYDMELEARKYE